MRIELLSIDGCPNSAEAGDRVLTALSELGHHTIPLDRKLITSSADTVGTAFAGAPTITLEGTDIFPAGAPSSELACRIYQTPDGFAGLPTIEQIKAALKDHGL